MAETFTGGAKAARLAWSTGARRGVGCPGIPPVVFDFGVDRGTVVAIEWLLDPEALGPLDRVGIEE